MHPLEKYDLIQGENISFGSPLCSAAYSLSPHPTTEPLHIEIQALIFSFFNQKRVVIEAYQKLYDLFQELNSASDRTETIQLSGYDIKSMDLDGDIRNYAYLYIISMKTVLDSFTCLVDIIQNQTLRKNKYPDFHNYLFADPEHPIEEMKKYFRKIKRPKKTYWITILCNVRNNMIHGGFLLTPYFSFKKGSSLLMRPYKGNDYYSEETIDIGQLFDGFMARLPRMEQDVVDIFSQHSSIFPNGINHSCSMSFGGLITEYHFKDYEY
jgi:hypothetical protein